MKFYGPVVPMPEAQAKEVAKLHLRRLGESMAASANAKTKQANGKYLRRARATLNDRRNFHAKHPNSSGGHACKAPGSMKG